mgnify:CR=1 FL=1
MKKSSLLKMKDLYATEEMLAVAHEDVPVKIDYGWTVHYRSEYSGFARSAVEGDVLKVALYDHKALRLGGKLPVYEVFINRERQQFLTYDHVCAIWRTAKINNLKWEPTGASKIWISDEDAVQILQYLSSDQENAYRAILDFQLTVRDRELERRHRKETDPWDVELAQTPPLPKDWDRWVKKVGIRTNYIFYDYCKGGAKRGYCTYCEKEVALKRKPYHNRNGRCPKCRHRITFKAKGKMAERFYSPTECVYLPQKCGDGFVIRQFQINRLYQKADVTSSTTSCTERQRIFYHADLSSHPYYWGWYKQRHLRWVEGMDEYYPTAWGYAYNRYCYQAGSIYGKTIASIASIVARTGLTEYAKLCQGCVSPNWYLIARERFPRIEQICKAGLSRLTVECMESANAVKSCIQKESETSLVKALALDTHRLSRLRTLNGGAIMLDWLQREKCSGKIISDDTLRWLEQENIHVSDISFILDRMSEQQVCNYLRRQKNGTRDSLQQIISTWKDYLSMANKLGINTNDEIVYRVKLLRQRHDELVEQMQSRRKDLEAAEIAQQHPKIAGICRLIKPKYEYTGEVYSIVVPSGVRDITNEGDALSHCVGKSDRYWERIEQQEAYILFLRKTAEIDKPYYTLEVEPNGTIRQKRTYFDRQNNDLKDAEKFLKEWQRVVAERLTESDREKAEKSKTLRLQEFEQLRRDDIRIHTGDLAGQRLVDVLASDLMETAA